jgi:hypothetical protein
VAARLLVAVRPASAGARWISAALGAGSERPDGSGDAREEAAPIVVAPESARALDAASDAAWSPGSIAGRASVSGAERPESGDGEAAR